MGQSDFSSSCTVARVCLSNVVTFRPGAYEACERVSGKETYITNTLARSLKTRATEGKGVSLGEANNCIETSRSDISWYIAVSVFS